MFEKLLKFISIDCMVMKGKWNNRFQFQQTAVDFTKALISSPKISITQSSIDDTEAIDNFPNHQFYFGNSSVSDVIHPRVFLRLIIEIVAMS